MEGGRDENFEVERAKDKQECLKWRETLTDPPQNLTPNWDLDPEHFYLAYDGDSPKDHPGDNFTLIEADTADVHPKLIYHSSRDKDPWDDEYRGRSLGTAFRWLRRRPVTPPLIKCSQNGIQIVGGNHRYHLAYYYGTNRMPFLVLKADLDAVVSLLPTAVITG